MLRALTRRVFASKLSTALAASALTAAALTTVGVAVVNVPSRSAATINGCYNRGNGQLRVDSSCKKNEIAISWNEQGPKGDPGPAGPAGPAGATGPKG
ncbi:MAG TPA: hypothetical protein VFV62_12085, partial [Gaiellaceae bacterium]|nr:hypothetical protein [Gaiellaceae bacterium]